MKKLIALAAAVAAITLVFTGCAGENKTVKKVNIYNFSSTSDKMKTINMFEDGFRFEIQDDEKAESNGIGRNATEQNSASGKERASRAEEWGYSLVALDGIVDGMGREIKSTIVGENAPKTREEAVEKIKQFLENQYKAMSVSGTYYSMNGHFPWHHYAGEAGFDILGSEIGENINNYQWHIALNRGAARQYSTPWFVDFSMWYSGYVRDYNSTPKWGESSGKDNGHSLSLFERSMIMSYMGGASSLVAEAGGHIAYNTDSSISPYGEVCKKINNFTSSFDRGQVYVPFALVLDFYHGTYSGVTEKLAFNTFKYNKGDKMTDSIINMLWNNSIEHRKATESDSLVNNPYGDLFDVLLQNADEKLLNEYPCIILSGDISFSKEDAEKFTSYVKNGGTLVMNSVYAEFLPELSAEYSGFEAEKTISYGSGKVIIYGGDYKTARLGGIIKRLTKQYVPFDFSGDIEYLINVKENSVVLTLINNDGVEKEPNMPEKINNKKDIDLTVGFNGTQNIKSVTCVYGDAKPQTDKNITSVKVKAGECVVLEYAFGE